MAVSKDGRMLACYPLWSGPHKWSVVEVVGPDASRAYHDEQWNSWKKGDMGKIKWGFVQAVYVDDENCTPQLVFLKPLCGGCTNN